MYLGIDIGTSSVKSVLIDASQRTVASASEALVVSRPEAGWSEQDPETWWDATIVTLDALAQSHPGEMAAVRGIGLSGQMHGATLLDETDAVLRPAILWNDGRAGEECAEIERRCPASRAISGNIAMPGFTAPKLAWVRKYEPAVFARVAKVLLPKDYVRLRLTGEYASDMSDSAGTLWMDVGRRDWSDDLLAATDLDRSHMPRLVEGTEVSGRVRSELSARWGFAAPPVVAGGGGDNAASACGMGTITPGSAFVSLGTSGVLFVSNAGFSPNTENAVHAFCHAVPDTWHQMGVILSATDSLEWLSRIFEKPAPDLIRDLGGLTPDPASVLFLPYLSGERTPHNDPHARGVFVGLGHETDRKSMTRAVLEGVAFAFRDCLSALNAAGTDIERATAVGGGSRSRLWLEILATVLGRPVDIPKEGDFGAAFGAARLGLIAAESVDPARICTPPAIETVIEPNARHAEAYEAAYRKYRSLYPAIKEVFRS